MACNSTTITKLAPELIYLILGYLDSPKDLYAVVQASSYIFCRIFSGSEDVLLSKVLRNAIIGPILPDALLSIYSLSLRRGSCRYSDGSHVRTWDLLRVIRRRREWDEIPRFVPDPRSLASLHLSIDYFIKHSSRFFLGTAVAEAEWDDDLDSVRVKGISRAESTDHLSDTELGRFQRAFYRYSMIQSLIEGADAMYELPVHDMEDVFSEYTPWEVEELGCVHQYILARLSYLLKQMEDHFVSFVTSTEKKGSSKYTPRGEEGVLGIESLQAEEIFHRTDDSLFLEEERPRSEKMMEHLASLGLPFLRELFEADYDRRKELLLDNHGYKAEALGRALRKEAMPPTPPIFEGEFWGRKEKFLAFEGDEVWKRNHAWLWAHQYHPQYDYYSLCNFDLRDWGYVFWDADRLEKMGVIKDPRPILFDRDFPPCEYDRGKRLCNEPSAQKRLRDYGYA